MSDVIKEKVEQRLQEKQKSKEFKDIGRVSNTRKELAAYRLVNVDNLDEIEQDKVVAYNMVKKDNVWKPYDVAQEKEKGVTSGAAYLKVKIRESLPAKPKDSEGYRKAYVTALTTIQNEFETCKTIDDIRNVTNTWYKLNPYQYTLKFVGGIPESITEEQFNKNYLEKLYYFRFTKIFEEQFGARFYNTVYAKSDAGVSIWSDAKKYDGIDEDLLIQYKEVIERNIQNVTTKYDSKIKQLVEANDKGVRDFIRDNISSGGATALALKLGGVEAGRQSALNLYQKEKDRQIKESLNKLQALKITQPDWSWGIKDFSTTTNEETGEVVVKPKAKAINSKEPLAYIKRTGGYEIKDLSAKAIVDIFGFSSVNYGNYVDDKWSKEHTKHFLGAMSDLGEILNIDIKKLTQLGGLKIAFGAKGRAGHLATYFPQTKDINLTKGNGDGSVAHEYGHYIDNVLMEGNLRSTKAAMLSELFTSQDAILNQIFRELMTYIYKGSPDSTPKLPIRFYNQEVNSKPVIAFTSGIKDWDYLSTIEETLEQPSIQLILLTNTNYYNLQQRVLGDIIKHFELEYYDVPFKLTTSYYYHKSKYNMFKYNSLNDKGKFVVSFDERTKYWTSAVELFARAFETVILKKFIDKNRVSNYLVDGIPLEEIIKEGYQVPYPSGKELAKIEEYFDKIIARIKEVYVIGNFVPPSDIRADEYIDLTPKGKDETAVVVKETPKGEVVEFKQEDETVKVIDVEEPKIENKADFVEKRIKALKISLRFSKDKEFIEKRIKALEISLKVLGKKKFAGGGGVETLLAPNGKPSNLTPEQYKLVRTKAFKDWFGDWENDPANSSKVVDENGEPLVV